LAALTKNAAAVKEKEPRCLMYEFFQPENAEEIVLLEKYVHHLRKPLNRARNCSIISQVTMPTIARRFPKMEDFYVHLEQPHTQAFLKEAETLMEGEPKVRLSNGPNGQGGFAR
jgi:quinol monooxygenase YgiN